MLGGARPIGVTRSSRRVTCTIFVDHIIKKKKCSHIHKKRVFKYKYRGGEGNDKNRYCRLMEKQLRAEHSIRKYSKFDGHKLRRNKNAMCTHVALAAQPLEQVVRLELVLLVGHYARHFERQPGFGHLVLEQALAHRVERRRHHVARTHRPEVVHHQHCPSGVQTNTLLFRYGFIVGDGDVGGHTTGPEEQTRNVARRAATAFGGGDETQTVTVNRALRKANTTTETPNVPSNTDGR